MEGEKQEECAQGIETASAPELGFPSLDLPLTALSEILLQAAPDLLMRGLPVPGMDSGHTITAVNFILAAWDTQKLEDIDESLFLTLVSASH